MNDGKRDDRYWVGFNIVRGIGPTRLRALLDYFGDAERAWHGASQELRSAGLDRRSLESLLAARAALDLDRELERIADAGAHVLTWENPGYPRLLREIHDPPLCSTSRAGSRRRTPGRWRWSARDGQPSTGGR